MVGRVLVVDDDALIRRVAERSLARAGFDLSTAGTAEQAYVLSTVFAFDVAIIDYFLGPGECGCDLIASLRARNPAIRIAVLSGLGVLPDIVRHAHAAGADVVATKANVDWPTLARGESPLPPAPIRPTVDLAALKRDVIVGTLLVHRRNISTTARALGMTRSSLQRLLRSIKPPVPDDAEE